MGPDDDYESLTDAWYEGYDADGSDRLPNGERYDGMPDDHGDDDD
jgi:hypothetical protein